MNKFLVALIFSGLAAISVSNDALAGPNPDPETGLCIVFASYKGDNPMERVSTQRNIHYKNGVTLDKCPLCQ
jgi:hypothetical protein